jgi:heme/copper-type cytochrome/quinol oxidase subunit 2
MFQLNTFIIILVAIFVVVGIIMAVSMVRLRNRGKDVSTVTAPIPEREQSNKQTRLDNTTDTSPNGSSPRSERERNRS